MDVIVVGAGPAGATAARVLAEGGLLHRIPTHWISRLHLEAPDGASVTLESPEPAALMIRRVEFDALLVALARDAGVEVRDGVDVSRARRLWTGSRSRRARAGRFAPPCSSPRTAFTAPWRGGWVCAPAGPPRSSRST